MKSFFVYFKIFCIYTIEPRAISARVTTIGDIYMPLRVRSGEITL